MNELVGIIKQESVNVYNDVVGFRRHIHSHPELSFEEHHTAGYISSLLRQHNIAHTTGIAGTGISGIIEGVNPKKKVIALRADIDALPITELNETEYRSKNEGIMHACGHDVHTASLLGTLIILNKLRANFEGTIKFIFQPGEEKLPGGASLMIREGVLRDPKVDAIFGQHVSPELDAGKVGFRSGMFMASTDEIYITVKGKGGHAAMPHQVTDTVYITAQLIVGLQQIVSRRADPTLPTVLSFGKIEAPGATNVIPGEVKIEGTFRTFDEKWRREAHALIKEQASGITHSYGGNCIVDIKTGYPALINNQALTATARKAAYEYLGEENVMELPMRTTAEDFAFYSQEVPACFYRLGVRNETRGIIHSVHHPRFDIEEEAFKTSVGLMAWLAINGTGL